MNQTLPFTRDSSPPRRPLNRDANLSRTVPSRNRTKFSSYCKIHLQIESTGKLQTVDYWCPDGGRKLRPAKLSSGSDRTSLRVETRKEESRNSRGRKCLSKSDRSTASCGNFDERRNSAFLPSFPPFLFRSLRADSSAVRTSTSSRLFALHPRLANCTWPATRYASRTVRTKPEAEKPEDSSLDSTRGEIANSHQLCTARGYEDGQEEQQAQAGYHRSTHHRHVL